MIDNKLSVLFSFLHAFLDQVSYSWYKVNILPSQLQ